MTFDQANLRKLTREVRQLAGLERTPMQILGELEQQFTPRKANRAMRGLLEDREALAAFARVIMLPEWRQIDSSEWFYPEHGT